MQKPRIRQSGRKPNKLEAAFMSAMAARGHVLLYEAITLLLANGVRYTPDFAEVHSIQRQPPDDEGYARSFIALSFYETKGPRFEEDARVKLKVAASVYPDFRFMLVTQHKELSDPWLMQRIRS